MDINNINDMAEKLLNNFGNYYDPDEPWINGTSDPYVKLENFGLEIREYVKADFIEIYYDKKRVFNYKEKYVADGVWLEILKEYYNKIPTIIARQEEDKNRQYKCNEMITILSSLIGISSSYLYFDSSDVKTINEHLKLVINTKVDKYHCHDEVLQLYYYNDIVLQYNKYEYMGTHDWLDNSENCSIYKSGPWEREINELKEIKDKEYEKKLSLSRLNELRNL